MEPTQATALAEHCARLPLTLRIAGELALANPATTLHDLLGELRVRRLDALDGSGDPRTAIRSVFSWSHQHLSDAAAATFALLGLHPGRDIEVPTGTRVLYWSATVNCVKNVHTSPLVQVLKPLSPVAPSTGPGP